MRRPTTALAGTLLALALALAGCSGTDAGTTSSPGATTTAEPSTSTEASAPTATPSTSASVDPAQDPLYLEAVDVYKKYFAEMQKFEAAGYPTKTLPPVMDKYIAGSMKVAVQKSIDTAREQNLAPEKGASSRLIAIAPNPGVQMAGSEVSIRVCTDARHANVVDSRTGKVLGKGFAAYKEVFFTHVDGTLKGVVQTAKDIETCPIAS